MAGQTCGTLPGKTSAGGCDAFVRKYDARGNEVWTRQFGSSADDGATAISIDADANVYVAGQTCATLPGKSSDGGCDAFVRKYDASGKEVWTRQFGSSATDRAWGISIDANGNVYVAGSTFGDLPGKTSSGLVDAFVRKYDSSGNRVWTRQFGSSDVDEAFDISVDTSGVYVAGLTRGTLPSQTSAGGSDAFVRKYDASGKEVWTRQFGSSADDGASGVSVDTSGVYAAGSTGGTFPGQTSAGGSDAFVRKYDASGNVAWTRQFGSSADDGASGVSVDTSGVYVAGSTTGRFPGQTSAGGRDAFVRRYDAKGNVVWTRQFGSSANDGASGVSVDTSGVYVAGQTCDTFDQSSAVGCDAFVAKLPVQDNSPPVIDAHASLTAEAMSAAGAVVSYDSPATHDAVDGDGIANCSPLSGSLFPVGDTSVTCTATDASGNSAAPVTFLVHVVDTIPPTIDPHADVTAEAASGAGTVVGYSSPGTRDAVGGNGVASCLPGSGSLLPRGDTTITCTASDTAGNRAAPVSFAVHVVDVTPPTIDPHADVTAEASSGAEAMVGYSSPLTHDAVDGDGVASCLPGSGSLFPLGDTAVTCTASDPGGNPAAPVSFAVHVVDTTPPVIDPHADVIAEASSGAGALVSYSSPLTRDAVNGHDASSCSPSSASLFSLGDTTVTCTASDARGNRAAPVSFVVHVVDVTPPTIDPIAGVTAEATSGVGAMVAYSSPVTHDAVDGEDVASCLPGSGNLFALGDTTVICADGDAAGNPADPVILVVHVVDTTPPTIDSHVDVTAEATGADGAMVSYTSPTRDAVDGDGMASCSPSSDSLFPLRDTAITCTASDAAGNPAGPVSFMVHVVDTTPPVIDPHADVTAEAISAGGVMVSYSSPLTRDAVDGNGMATCSPDSGSLFPVGDITVTCAATDATGNPAAPVGFMVHVADTTPPVIDRHADVTAEATAATGAMVSYSSPGTRDAVDGDGAASCWPGSGSLFPVGDTTVACAASDTAGNPVALFSFMVHVVDTTPPVIDPHADVSAEATAADGAVVSYTSPDTRDAVDGDGVASCLPGSGSFFPLGDSTVPCTASDTAGNPAALVSFMVHVVDTTPPVIDRHAEVTAAAAGSTGAMVSYSSPGTRDAVEGDGVASCSPGSSSLFPLGDTTVTCTASDTAGNSAALLSFMVHVLDTTPPQIDPHADVTAEATAADGAMVSYSSPGTSDAVDGDGMANCSPDSGSLFPLGASTVTCAASDTAGNPAALVSFMVHVSDTSPPEIDRHADVTTASTAAAGAMVSYSNPGTRDAADGDGMANCSPGSGSLFPLGDTTVTCTATDAAGNPAVPVSFVLHVVDTKLSAKVMDDPLNPGQMALVVGGSSNKDLLEVRCNGHSVAVKIQSKGFRSKESFTGPIGRIIAYGSAGDDTIAVKGCSIPAWLFGDEGRDKLVGDRGSDILVGGEGDDDLDSGEGRDLLIGGRGRDHLRASADDNLLVAGFTDFDGNMTALQAIMAEWTRTDQSYQKRVDHLLMGNGLNGLTKLDPSTVHDDGAGDFLEGAPKTIAMDWFLANLDGDADKNKKDKANGLTPGRIATDINLP